MIDQEVLPHESLAESPEATLQRDSNQVPPTRRGCFHSIVGAVGCVLLIIIVLGAQVIFGVTSVDRIVSGIGSIFSAAPSPSAIVISSQTIAGSNFPSPSATVISSQTIVESILPLAQLVTVSDQFAKVNVKVTVNQGVLNMCSYSANHAVQGTIVAGIDVTKISASALRYDDARETYVLTVIAPELTSCRIDYIQQYEWSVSTCNPDWDGARLLANYQTLTQFRDDALEGGIIERAELEVRLVLGSLVRLLTGHPVEIVFQQPDATVMAASCTVESPQGWTYDPTANLWSR